MEILSNAFYFSALIVLTIAMIPVMFAMIPIAIVLAMVTAPILFVIWIMYGGLIMLGVF